MRQQRVAKRRDNLPAPTREVRIQHRPVARDQLDAQQTGTILSGTRQKGVETGTECVQSGGREWRLEVAGRGSLGHSDGHLVGSAGSDLLDQHGADVVVGQRGEPGGADHAADGKDRDAHRWQPPAHSVHWRPLPAPRGSRLRSRLRMSWTRASLRRRGPG